MNELNSLIKENQFEKEKKYDLSIVIPCYNEEKNISLIVHRFNQIKSTNCNAELVFVDNGSTDKTHEIITSLAKQYTDINIVTVNQNIGYGNGIWQGLKQSNGEFLCWTHADMQTDLYDTIKAYRLIIKKRNPKEYFIKGRRRGRPFVDTFFTFGMSVFETLALRTFLYDINAQPNLFHKSFLENTPNPPQDFSFDLYFYYMAKTKNYKFIKFPVIFAKRIHGESHWNTGLRSKWKFIKRTIDFTLKFKKNLNMVER